MDQVRLGVIGCGSMGSSHLKYLGELDGCTVAAVADRKAATVNTFAQSHDCKGFESGAELIESGEVDAVLIATPHYDHPVLGKLAFEKGIHVLCEKPAAVTAKAAEEFNAAYEKAKADHPDLKFGLMFNQRTRPVWKKIKQFCEDGSVGELVRVGWTITNWYRSQAYYNSGGWRATWSGEGGGVLINQCPHNLDLFQWFVGMPSTVMATASLGKYHDIEVEDDISALLTFENGATGTFTTSTGQCPGMNRLEIVGDRGTIIYDDGNSFDYFETDEPVSEFTHKTSERFAEVGTTRHSITCAPAKAEHRKVTEAFIASILTGSPLVAEGTEGIHGLELGNAMLMSGLSGKPVNVPTDRDAFAKMIEDLAANSTFKKKEVVEEASADLSGSF